MKRIDINDLLTEKEILTVPDKEMFTKVKAIWDGVAKPIDSLGKFELITSKIGAIHGSETIDIRKKAVVTMCADNGVVEEGISQSGQDVTLAVSKFMGLRGSSVCKMAKKIGMDIIPVDIGINTDEKLEGVLDRKISKGTKNFAKEPAMTKEQALQALQIGMDVAFDAVNDGYRLLCTGEMGIGNTTTSAAVGAALIGCRAAEMTGRGSGLSNEGLAKKEKVCQEAIDNYGLYGADPIKILSCVGGYDIAGMAGIMIGGACYHIPVVIDGVISTVAALVAVRLFPEVKEYLIASHMSKEPAARKVMAELGAEPVIDANMALGEGTGAVMMCSLMDIALTLYSQQLTFDDLEIEAYSRFDEEK